ncbi:peptidyl-prolyl cis-trans isomerase [Aureococcus anophagefferens]|uniref:peptidylprolyl isomerase n=1 Tax=Aureococcus anophagefferens TaxID=44056 RepID=A0ABR1FK15_AURAN
MAPKTVKNFKALCTGECGLGATTKKPLHYKGCPVHRVIPGFMIQGGDFSNKNGTGGESIYGGKFADEPFAFFVTLAPTPHLDNKHVCFGEVSGGMEIIRAVEKVDTYRARRAAAAQRVLITDCGVKREGQDFETAVAARDVASQKKKEKKEKKKSKKEAKKKAEKKAKKDAEEGREEAGQGREEEGEEAGKGAGERHAAEPRAGEQRRRRYYPAGRPRAASYGDRQRSGDRPRADSYGDRPRSGDRPRADSYGDRPRADSYGERARAQRRLAGATAAASRSPPRRAATTRPRAARRRAAATIRPAPLAAAPPLRFAPRRGAPAARGDFAARARAATSPSARPAAGAGAALRRRAARAPRPQLELVVAELVVVDLVPPRPRLERLPRPAAALAVPVALPLPRVSREPR